MILVARGIDLFRQAEWAIFSSRPAQGRPFWTMLFQCRDYRMSREYGSLRDAQAGVAEAMELAALVAKQP